jgi:EAL domain-containing protein (putative c-di-GMP-specific phosphodiesterase class I)
MSPVSWFRDADRYGLKLELELAAVQCGLLHLEDLPAHAFIAINVSPRAAVASETRRILDQVPLDRVVMEITEHEDVDSYAALSRSLLSLRVGGMQLAVDDAGAGFSSFKHVVHLQPDMIKLDGTWIEHVDADVARRALISAVVGFAAEMNAVVIGECVETAQQSRVLSDLGVNWGQGYYFGRPKPLRAPAAEGGTPN